VFNLVVGVVECLGKFGGELLSRRGLSGAHEADKEYVIRSFHTTILAVHTCPRAGSRPGSAAWAWSKKRAG
jgi:hypothetical protein